MGMLAPLGVSFEPGSVESERAFGDGQPDLTIYDSAGQHRLFVENKFWAGLTDAQPVTYLSHLPQDNDPSALVFLVPEERVRSVWAELRRRCTPQRGLVHAALGRCRAKGDPRKHFFGVAAARVQPDQAPVRVALFAHALLSLPTGGLASTCRGGSAVSGSLIRAPQAPRQPPGWPPPCRDRRRCQARGC